MPEWPMAHTLSGMLAKQDILEVLHRYCRAIDRRDPALLSGCFHEDSVHDQGGFRGSSRDFCALALERVASLPVTHHQLGSVLVELAGDSATSEAYFTAFHRIPAEGSGLGLFVPNGIERNLIVGGRYLDLWEQREGGWRIVRRQGIYDWQRQEACG